MIKYDHNMGYGITLVSDLVVRKNAKLSTRASFERLRAICMHFMRNPDPTVVPILDFQLLSEPKSQYGWFEYQYDMVRLGMLSHSEKNLIGHMNSYRRERWETESYVVEGRKNLPILYDFISAIKLQGRYLDLHEGNVLKDDQENFRIIDIEGFYSTEPLGHPSNDWITR
jgi:hypothetical protein